MSELYHLIAEADWLQAGDPYAPPSLAHEGFIHFSSAEQVAGTLQRFFGGRHDMLLLTIDPAALPSAPRWEEGEPGVLFPHLYAALPRSAVVAVERIQPAADGSMRRSIYR
jgi:uncharacterized protein (DUF952 family)